MKGVIPNNEKHAEHSSLKKNSSGIKFNLNEFNLACFKGKNMPDTSKVKVDQIKTLSKQKSVPKETVKIRNIYEFLQHPRPRFMSTICQFNEKVVIMQYDNCDVYVDNSSRKKTNSHKSKRSDSRGKKQQLLDQELQFLTSCLRAITEQTDNTSNNLSKSAQITPHNLTPQSLTPRGSLDQTINYNNQCEMPECYSSNFRIDKPIRNRRSVTVQESKNFIIDFDNIESDGRTTIMVKNIPNKYSQDMLLEQFSANHMNRFDFFYLPIDKDNECNIGYAFLNFISTSYIKSFYLQFHKKKWKKYKSPKICQLYYARYQGTLQLAHHFQHTKIIGKDKKVRPLIGLCEANRIKQIVENQRIKQ